MHPSSDTVHVENTSHCHSEAPLFQCCTPVPWGTEPSFIGTSFSSFLYLRLNKERLRRKQWRITGEDIYCLVIYYLLCFLLFESIIFLIICFIDLLSFLVAQSRLTLCNPMNSSVPGFPVLHFID